MALLEFQTMARDGITTPTTAASILTQTTSTHIGDARFGLLLTTAINGECLVDPDDKVGFAVMIHGTSTATLTLTLAAGEGWRASSAKTFNIGIATEDVPQLYWLGPFESAKYVRYDSTAVGTGKPHVALSIAKLAGDTPTCRVVAFKFPTVTYAT